MAEVVYADASRVYPGVRAVDRLDLTVPDGEFLVLVGPSGSGKSTALRMLAGLEDVDEGAIHIGQRDVTELPPKDRDIAMVFQSYALYPPPTSPTLFTASPTTWRSRCACVVCPKRTSAPACTKRPPCST